MPDLKNLSPENKQTMETIKPVNIQPQESTIPDALNSKEPVKLGEQQKVESTAPTENVQNSSLTPSSEQKPIQESVKETATLPVQPLEIPTQDNSVQPAENITSPQKKEPRKKWYNPFTWFSPESNEPKTDEPKEPKPELKEIVDKISEDPKTIANAEKKVVMPENTNPDNPNNPTK